MKIRREAVGGEAGRRGHLGRGRGCVEALFGSPRASFPAINSGVGARRSPSCLRRRAAGYLTRLAHWPIDINIFYELPSKLNYWE